MKPSDQDPLDDLIRRKLESKITDDDGLWNVIDREFDKCERRRVITWPNAAVALLLLSLVLGGVRYGLEQRTDSAGADATRHATDAVQQPRLHDGPNDLKSASSNEDAITDQTGEPLRSVEDISAVTPSIVAIENQQIETPPKRDSRHGNLETALRSENREINPGINDGAETMRIPFVETTPEKNSALSELNFATAYDSATMLPVRTLDALSVIGPDTDPPFAVALSDNSRFHRFKPNRVHWELGIQTQMVWVTKSFVRDADMPEQYYNRREREEGGALATAYGLRVGAEYRRFALQTGIGVRNVAEEIAYSGRSPAVRVQLDSYAGVTPLYDTTHVVEENAALNEQNGTRVNTYLEVPLLAGFRFGNKKFSLQPSAGIAFGKPLKWRSRYLNETSTALVDPTGDLNPILTSWLFELSASQRLGDAVRLNAFGVYHQNKKSVVVNGVDQRYRSIGGGVALTYTF